YVARHQSIELARLIELARPAEDPYGPKPAGSSAMGFDKDLITPSTARSTWITNTTALLRQDGQLIRDVCRCDILRRHRTLTAMSSPAFGLGIDFGTSNTVAMLRWPDGRVKPLLFDGSPLLPSAVFAAADGSLVVGSDALRHGRFAPE